MKKKIPLISIGLPVYNGDKFLSIALDSLINQTFQDFEIIIFDNASTDNTANICKKFKEKDQRIKYFRNKKNIGARNNFNIILNYVNTPYFMWAAHDDVWEPTYIEELIVQLTLDKSRALIFSMFDSIDENGNVVRNYPKMTNLLTQFSSNDMFFRVHQFINFNERDGKANLIYGIMRTKIIKKIGGIIQYSDKTFGIDNLTLLLILLEGKFYIMNKLLFHKRIYDNKNSKNKRYNYKSILNVVHQIMINIYNYFQEIHGFFTGYRQIIMSSPLTLYQKHTIINLTLRKEILWPLHILFQIVRNRKLFLLIKR